VAEVEGAPLAAVWAKGRGNQQRWPLWRPFGRAESDGGGGSLEAVYLKAVGSEPAVRSLVNMNDGGRG
jgi:hypothetical protein